MALGEAVAGGGLKRRREEDPLEDLWGSSFWSALIALRREVHQHPEPGFEEVRTQGRIREILLARGIHEADIRTAAITGLIVDIRGTATPRPEVDVKVHCVALRADLDALTMTEASSTLPYRSKREGVAHMCGHDGHLTTLVGVAILLRQRADRLPSNLLVRLLFQPAEEGTPAGTGGFDFAKTGGGGAVPMVWDGCLEGVDEVYGWHNWPAWPLGELRLASGPVMAHETEFEVVIRGRGGHGSQPHVTKDPVVAGAAVVSALQTIVSRSLPSFTNAVVSVTMFHAGERFNVIPDEARLEGTIRDVDEAVFATIQRRFREVVEGVCAGLGCSAEIDLRSCNPVLVNSAGPTEVVRRCAASLTDQLALKTTAEGLPLMGGEDFAYYAQKRPSCYFFLGTQEPLTRGLATFGGSDKGQMRSNCICHGTSFDFNDNVLPSAVALMVRIVEDRLGVELYSQEEILGASMGGT